MDLTMLAKGVNKAVLESEMKIFNKKTYLQIK